MAADRDAVPGIHDDREPADGRDLLIVQRAVVPPADRFADDLDALRDALTGSGPITARPAVGRPPPVFVLAVQRGLEFAGEAGLPAVVGGPLLRNPDALGRYRERAGESAYLIVSADIMIADNRERARQLLLPEAWAMVRSRETGEFGPLGAVDSILSRRLTARHQMRIDRWLSDAIYGNATEVATQLDELIARTGADEIMATTSTYADVDRDAADVALVEVVSARTAR